MNTNPNAIRILCYGDSNTWGYIPGQNGKRFPIDKRWTGILQKYLGDEYEIIEEGLSGRTTTIEDSDRPGINGETYLLPCLESHRPINLVILMLGTNDLKQNYNKNPQEVTENVEKLLQLIKNYTSKNSVQIILICPPEVDEGVAGVELDYKGGGSKSKELGRLYSELSEKLEIEYIDLGQIVKPSKIDGYHLDQESHEKIANELTNKIRGLIIKY